MFSYPDIVVHADWGSNPEKRWMCVAKLASDHSFFVESPELVGNLDDFWESIHTRTGSVHALVGFDFPIGLPRDYAQVAGIRDFKAALEIFGTGDWATFYDLACEKEEIGIHRPFYPYRPGGTRQAHLLDGLGLSKKSQLLRRCERKTSGLGAASPLFWTLGGKQVGRAAIIGWRDVITPALQHSDFELKLWPFDGPLSKLLASNASVVVETYPASACVQLGLGAPGRSWSKTSQDGRGRHAERLLSWARSREVTLSDSLVSQLSDGIGSTSGGEDPFDAMIGLLSMIDVLLRDRDKWAPEDPAVHNVEGWILGREFALDGDAAA
mgnify:CR=1 FL=1